MNSRITGVREADCFLLVGCNPDFDSPLIEAQIRKNQKWKRSLVGVVGRPPQHSYR